MAQEHDQPDPNSPQFEPSPRPDQPGPPPEATAYGGKPIDPVAEPLPTATASEHPLTKPPATTPPIPPTKPKVSAASITSSSILLLVGAAIAAGAFGLARVFAPPTPPGEVSEPPKDMVKTEEFKKLSDRVDQMAADLGTAKQQIADRPDYSSELKMQRDRTSELARSLANIPAQFDSVNQKLTTVTRIEDANSSNRVDSIEKRVRDLAQMVDTLRTSPRSSSSPSTNREPDPKIDRLAMNQIVELYKSKKWAEAKDGFVKLQTIHPNDATVWYYSALSNGFATGEWLGDTEKMVNIGLEKEKAGQPDSATVDAVFNDLTPATGKNWLAEYRKRIGVR